MLQQTQVERVVPKYKAFLKRWPTVKKLSQASLGEVLTEWQGLGYNRRAKMLWECAKTVYSERNGKFPNSYEELKNLPGIGPYTAGAVMAFAYNQPVPIIETNIRTVYLHHFFKNKAEVADKEIIRLIVRTLDQGSSREWYWALMDYGSYLKKEHRNVNQRSKSYVKQSKFAGSDRQIRGAIIRVLASGKVSENDLVTTLHEFDSKRVKAQLGKLVDEEMVLKNRNAVRLPD